ncbi:endonuclease III domain-containing protein [Salinisphaera hydrothermalis]|uniref:endonuclease III domain-containing protein n=1 Tax=Salinisphaera hydrothermalis TaxID=563188 RepID=UPI00333E2CEE
MSSHENKSSGLAGARPTAAAIVDFHDRLAAAYGPQHWWPIQDPANPRFEILIGAVLTQHTAWTNVEIAITALREAGSLTPEAMLAHDDLPALIRRAGPHRIKAERLRSLCRWFVERGGFAAIETLDTVTLCRELRSLHGIGPETADVIALYAFDRPRFVADAYAFRILERYGWWQGARRYERLRETIEAALGDDASAGFYDELHALIVAHAKQRCHKRAPDCGRCALAATCEYARAAGPA